MSSDTQVAPAPAKFDETGDISRGRPQSFFLAKADRLAAAVVVLGLGLRAWMAHATFFNIDEAWHFSAANQDSLLHAYQASLTLWHPPLLVCLLYFWRNLGTSDLVLRLPCVIAGATFCWFYYKWLALIFNRAVAWIGLLLVTFLPTMIAMSADLRQYPLMLAFAIVAAYFLERALIANSAGFMLLSSVFLWLAMLTHYSGFLFAASIGVYAIVRMFRQSLFRQSTYTQRTLPQEAPAQTTNLRVVAVWILGQVVGLGLAAFLYVTQITRLHAASAAEQPLHRFAEWYIPQFYYHPEHDHLALFLFRGTFGIFRFIFAWVVVGHLATLLFLAGVILLLRRRAPHSTAISPRLAAILLFWPFLLSWIAVAAGIYPFGRTRHSIFLVIFAIAGVSFALTQIAKQNVAVASAITVAVIILCAIFGTPPWRDMLPLAERRHEHMDRALEFIHTQVSPANVIYLNKGTELQLGHYLCDQKPVAIDRSVPGFESFQCHGLRVISTFPNDDAVELETLPVKWKEMARAFNLKPGTKVWLVEGGWTSGFSTELKSRYPEFAGIEAHSFGHYLEIFPLTVTAANSPPTATPQT